VVTATVHLVVSMSAESRNATYCNAVKLVVVGIGSSGLIRVRPIKQSWRAVLICRSVMPETIQPQTYFTDLCGLDLSGRNSRVEISLDSSLND